MNAPEFPEKVHLHTLSKASWDEIYDEDIQYEHDMPRVI